MLEAIMLIFSWAEVTTPAKIDYANMQSCEYAKSKILNEWSRINSNLENIRRKFPPVIICTERGK